MRKILVLIVCALLINLGHARRAPIVLDTLTQEHIAFASLRGHWVFINYWASWCDSCRAELATFNQLAHDHPHTVRVFSVNIDALSRNKKQKQAQQFHILYPSLSSSTTKRLHLPPITVVPTTVVFNPQGTLAATLYGEQPRVALEKFLSLRHPSRQTRRHPPQ